MSKTRPQNEVILTVQDLVEIGAIDQAVDLFLIQLQDSKEIEDEADKIIKKYVNLEKKLDRKIEEPDTDPKKKLETLKELHKDYEDFFKEIRDLLKKKVEFKKKHKEIPPEIEQKNKIIFGGKGLIDEKLIIIILEALIEKFEM